MAKLSPAEIKGFATGAGFTGDDANIAVAVALAESGGDPNSHNSTPPDDSYGLMQINMLGSLGPARRKQFGLSSNTQLYDPATNMKAAKAIQGSSGWHAWTTYTSGKYKAFLDASNETPASAQPSNDTSQFGGITASINNIGQNIFKGFANITGISVAIVLLLAGVVLFVVNSKGAKSTVKLASKVIA